MGQACVAAGTTACARIMGTPRAEGEVCLPGRNDCGPGLVCLPGDKDQICYRMCPRGSRGFCGPTKRCGFAIGGESCVQACAPHPTPCDIYAQTCTDPALACTLATDRETGERYTGCASPGPRKEGESCGVGNVGTCAKGLVCVSNACRRVCKMDGSLPCPDPQKCMGPTAGWSITYCM
jgi:hypothetical protein